jgi:hypothetical protein
MFHIKSKADYKEAVRTAHANDLERCSKQFFRGLGFSGHAACVG